MNRKADANMWWIIIGAVLALVVMIVMLVFFTQKSGQTGSALLDCESKGGFCTQGEFDAPSGTNICPEGSVKSVAFQCTDKTKLCCFRSPE